MSEGCGYILSMKTNHARRLRTFCLQVIASLCIFGSCIVTSAWQTFCNKMQRWWADIQHPFSEFSWRESISAFVVACSRVQAAVSFALRVIVQYFSPQLDSYAPFPMLYSYPVSEKWPDIMMHDGNSLGAWMLCRYPTLLYAATWIIPLLVQAYIGSTSQVIWCWVVAHPLFETVAPVPFVCCCMIPPSDFGHEKCLDRRGRWWWPTCRDWWCECLACFFREVSSGDFWF